MNKKTNDGKGETKMNAELEKEFIHFVQEVKRVADDGLLTPEWSKMAAKLLKKAKQEVTQ